MTELNEQSKLQISSAVGEIVEDVINEIIDAGVEFKDGIKLIGESISPTWSLPPLWDDSDVEPSSRLMLDVDYSQYSNLFTPGSSGIIAASTISQRTFGLILASIVATVAAYFGVKKGAAVLSLLYKKFFGVTLKGIDEKVDQVQETLEQAIKGGVPFSGTSTERVDEIYAMLQDLTNMLDSADVEFSSLAEALFNNNRNKYIPLNWKDATTGFYSPSAESED